MRTLIVRACTGACIFCTALVEAGHAQAPAVLGAVYRADTPFPEYTPLWREGWNWLDDAGRPVQHARPDMPLGGYIQAYVRNTAAQPLVVKDLLLNGASLTEAVVPEPEKKGGKYASSILFSKLDKTQIDRVIAAGEPAWWKVDPEQLPAGGIAELTIRLRRPPALKAFDLTLRSDSGDLRIPLAVGGPQPHFAGISFSRELDRAFLYIRTPERGMRPSKVLMDGTDLTAHAAIVADKAVDLAVAAVSLPAKLREPDLHLFQAVYADGSQAIAAIRVWEQDFVYGMWGTPKAGDSPEERARRYILRLHEHNINTVMSHYGGEVRKFAAGQEGRDLCDSLGMRLMDHVHGTVADPIYYYLPDEPDAHDFSRRSIEPPGRRVGSLAQWVIECGRDLRAKDPDTLLLCNVDNTFKPEQWYTYAQLPDVICADPYFQEQLRSVYRCDPDRLNAYRKPTYVYAAGRIYQSAGAPKPMHIILHSCRFDMKEDPFRPPTPDEKRVEVYYALAAGAKGISYWWYTPSAGRYYGCGGTAPEMVRLLTEIGLLGAELRTAGPLLRQSCPADVHTQAPETLWVRTLLSGTDTLLVVIVNDTISCTREGTTVTPIENARVRVDVPAWLKPADVFEVACDGTRDARWQADGPTARIDLGQVGVTRLILITADTQLRARLQRLYDAQFAANVTRLLAGRERAR